MLMESSLCSSRLKGVMNVVSSNAKENGIVFSCGNADDGRIKVWNILERQILFQFPDPANTRPFYSLSMVVLEHNQELIQLKKVPQTEHTSQADGISELDLNVEHLIFATSGSEVSMFEISPKGQVVVSGPLKCQAELGTYLAASYISKVAERHFRFTVSNIKGNLEFFDCILGIAESSSPGPEMPLLHPLHNLMDHMPQTPRLEEMSSIIIPNHKFKTRIKSEKVRSQCSKSNDPLKKSDSLKNLLSTPDFNKKSVELSSSIERGEISHLLRRNKNELMKRRRRTDFSGLSSHLLQKQIEPDLPVCIQEEKSSSLMKDDHDLDGKDELIKASLLQSPRAK